ncbi:MAG: glycosyltransferase [Chitinophagaceae bacterium]
MQEKRPLVLLVCTGLGKINRGYESFTRECFNNLKDNTGFDLCLVKGAGASTENEFTIGNLHRNSAAARWLAKILGKEPYFVEQLTFSAGMLPLLIRRKPALIYFSDFELGAFLWKLRSFFKFKYRLLFSNGAPNGPPFTRTDHIQQLLPVYVKQATQGNTPEAKQTLLPYAIEFSAIENIRKLEEKKFLREHLQLPPDKKIVISIGAVNSEHKRMDYVVKEFSLLDCDKYFLVILGQIGEESKSIISLAEEKLMQDSYLIRQVQNEQVKDYLFAADYFILASLNEGLPRVLPEALSAGLLPIVHDYVVTRQTLNEYGIFKNLEKPNMLLFSMQEVDRNKITKEELIRYAWKNYAWENLAPAYANLIKISLSGGK